jgi:peptidoglycan/xylan/chitin deacetylase (PgdA/CDA1 family)
MYHRLVGADHDLAPAGTEHIFSIPADRFESQLRALQAAGWSFVSLSDAIEIIRGRRRLAGPSILVSFDDGCQSIYHHALPVLESLRIPAVVFVTTDPSSPVFHDPRRQDPRLSESQLRDMIERGIAIGSHGVSHRPLSGLDGAQIRSELSESRSLLESICGAPVTAFAIPGNWYDARVLAAARAAGYTSVWTSDPGFAKAGSDIWRLPRINVEGDCSPDALLASLQPGHIAARRAAMELKKLPKRIFGPDRWMALRSRIYSHLPARFASTSRIARILMIGAAVGIAAATVALLLWGARLSD